MKLKFLIINILLIGYLNVIANAEEIQKKQTKFEGINFILECLISAMMEKDLIYME